MRAYINTGTSPGPFCTHSTREIDYRDSGIFLLFQGRWRRVRRVRGFDYVTIDGQPCRVIFE
jgi:hypothetical protein